MKAEDIRVLGLAGWPWLLMSYTALGFGQSELIAGERCAGGATVSATGQGPSLILPAGSSGTYRVEGEESAIQLESHRRTCVGIVAFLRGQSSARVRDAIQAVAMSCTKS